MRLILITILATTLFGCSQKKNIGSQNMDTKVATQTTTEAAETTITFDNDCFKDRATRNQVTDQEASMVLVMDYYMFTFENTRWQPCFVPEEYQVEGLKVKVSGELLEIKPGERRAGSPFKITKLSKIE